MTDPRPHKDLKLKPCSSIIDSLVLSPKGSEGTPSCAWKGERTGIGKGSEAQRASVGGMEKLVL